MKNTMITVIFALLLLGCTGNVTNVETNGSVGIMEKVVARGDFVKADYLGTFENGTVFDTSIKAEAEKAGFELRPNYEPLLFRVGEGSLIKGFEDGVIGMKEGDEKVLVISPSEAYGERDEKMVFTLPESKVDAGAKLYVGQTLQTSTGARGTVVALKDGSITIDFNHPLAGKTLIFRIFVREIEKSG